MCSVVGCQKPAKTNLCVMHYTRQRRHGDPLKTTRCPPGLSLQDRFEWHGWTVTESGCWEFDGSRNEDGYGLLKYRGRKEGAHRWAYRLWIGPIPEGHVVRHRCDNPPCIRPSHLETGLQADNVRDTAERGRARSRRGLTDDQIREIREWSAMGLTQISIEARLGLSTGTVCRILKGQIYRNVN